MIRFDNVCIDLGACQIRDLTMEVPSGSVGVLMGRTGSGKTTLIECACGLRKLSAGQIWLGDIEVSNLPPAARNIGYVPQDGALFPKMSIARHLEFPLIIRRRPEEEIADRRDSLAKSLKIEHLLERYPQGLSGGEIQRVAIGRALAARPSTLFLDEPFSALDDETRLGMYELLDSILQETGVTVLHVTHSESEANRVGHRLYRLDDGKVHLAWQRGNSDGPESSS